MNDWFAINVAILLIGLTLLVGMPIYFVNKNARLADQAEFDEFVKKMLALDKIYAPHIRQLNKNLNIINHWLKTGNDPTESEEESEKIEQEDRFFAGLMNPLEAKKWREAVKKAKGQDADNIDVKSLRVDSFVVNGMEPLEVEQPNMKFVYDKNNGDCIYYCINPEVVQKKRYRHIIFYTTARPTNLPLVYPYKYEGAQMLSLYKHPAQTVWFLKNWKLIREGLESLEEEIVELDESLVDFDL